MDVTYFSGLNNVSDPLRVGISALTVADNVHVDDTGGVSVRSGYSLAQSGSFTGIYTTKDFLRMYVVDNGNLRTFGGKVLTTGLSSAEMYWTEINGQVFYNNGVDSGVIGTDDTIYPWRWSYVRAPTLARVTGTSSGGLFRVRTTSTLPDGRETGPLDTGEIELGGNETLQVSNLAPSSNVYIASPDSTVFQLAYSGGGAFVFDGNVYNLGRELNNSFLEPLPLGAKVVQEWRGAIYATQYMPTEDQTVIWWSEPMGYHLFDLSKNFMIVPGHATMLAPTKEFLIIGTGSCIYATDKQSLQVLAEYGVVPGQHWDQDDDRTLFWTTRGLCAAMPFKNLTERQVSVAPGVQAGGTIVRSGGQKRYVVALQSGGAAFNSYV
jgi:hypothetical protein